MGGDCSRDRIVPQLIDEHHENGPRNTPRWIT